MAIAALPAVAVLVAAIYGANAWVQSNEKKCDAVYREKDSRLPPIPALFPATGPLAERFRATGEIAVSYAADFKATWRCLTYAMQRNVGLLLLGITLSVIVAVFSPPYSPYPNLFWIVSVKFVAALLTWIAFNYLVLWLKVKARFPAAKPPAQTITRIMEPGFEDISGEKVANYDWGEVTSIREAKGDIYVWSAKNGGSPVRGFFVPCEAFQSPEEMQCFRDIAIRLWKSQGEAWAEITPDALPLSPNKR